jgi:putative flippase GtrA
LTTLIRQASGYLGASAVAFGVDVATLTLLVSGLAVPYLAAATVSFLCGTAVMYWLSIRHIFDYRRLDDWRPEFMIFAALGMVGLLVNLSVMYALVSGVGVHYLVAKVGAAGCTVILNFLLRRWMLFSRRGDQSRVTTQMDSHT